MTMASSDFENRTIDRLRLGLQYYHWLLMTALVFITLALAYWGFHLQGQAMGEHRSPLDMLYASLQLFVLETAVFTGPITWPLPP